MSDEIAQLKAELAAAQHSPAEATLASNRMHELVSYISYPAPVQHYAHLWKNNTIGLAGKQMVQAAA